MRGTVLQLGPDHWRVWIEAGRDPLTRRRRRLTRVVRGTEDDAHAVAAALYLEVRGGRTGASPTTVAELLDAWLDHAGAHLAPYTLRAYRQKIDAYLRHSTVGHSPLARVTPHLLDRYYWTLGQRGGQDGAALSAQTVKHVHRILHRAFAQAVRWGWLDRNPAALAEPPAVPTRRLTPPTSAGVAAVLDQLDPDMADLARLAVVTGARRGELCGLRWGDVDLDGAELVIARAVVDVAGGTAVKSTKTGRERRLTIGAGTVERLAARRRREAEKALACGVRLDDTSYVFASTADGRVPLRPMLVTKRWAAAAARAGVAARFHDLRHLAATEMLHDGLVPDIVASARLGHSSTRTTTDIYGHARRARDRDAAEILERLLG